MNFLEICNRVNALSGLHGSMSSVTSTTDLQRQIANCVNEEWINLQNFRKDWTFMIKRHQTFICTPGQEAYSTTDPGGGVGYMNIDDLGTYRKRGIYLDNKQLRYVYPNEFPTIVNTTRSKPTWFTVDPKDNTLYLDLPDDAYNFDIYYRKQVQDLTVGSTPNTNIPELPVNYHEILVFGGLASFAVFIGDGDKYQKWNKEFLRMRNMMMREYIPSVMMTRRPLV